MPTRNRPPLDHRTVPAAGRPGRGAPGAEGEGQAGPITAEALDELFPAVYEELRELAHRHRTRWQGNDTLNTTVLVHEAYLKMARTTDAIWKSEAHFLATAAKAIRQILLNYARDQLAQKRGGEWERVPLSAVQAAGGATWIAGQPWEETVLALDEALRGLAERSRRQSRIVECRFFAEMTLEQTAAALGVSVPTVTRGWAMARAWLCRELGEGVGEAIL